MYELKLHIFKREYIILIGICTQGGRELVIIDMEHVAG